MWTDVQTPFLGTPLVPLTSEDRAALRLELPSRAARRRRPPHENIMDLLDSGYEIPRS